MSSAAAIAVEVNPIVTAIGSTTASVSRLMRVRELWESSRKSQLEIGRLLYEERAERLSVGGRGVYEGFHQWLRDAGIPKTSAYRRIAEYEISIGERAEDDKFDKPTPTTKPVPSGTTFVPANADVVQEERPATRGEMAYQSDPSAPISDIKAGTFDQEAFTERLGKIYVDALDLPECNPQDRVIPVELTEGMLVRIEGEVYEIVYPSNLTTKEYEANEDDGVCFTSIGVKKVKRGRGFAQGGAQ